MTTASPVVWLGIWLALDALRHGAQLVGSPGSGKSVLLKAFRGTLAACIRQRPRFDLHLFDWDTKRDLADLHRAFPDHCPVFDLNPFVWGDVYDPLAELDDPRDISELAAQVVDVAANSTQPFFPEAARLVLAKLLTRHWEVVPGQADLADLVLSANDAARLRRVARSHPRSKAVLPLVTDNEAGLSVLATLMNEVSKFEPIAALMRSNTRGRRVSVRSILKSRFSVTKLPYDDKSVATLAPFIRLFLTRLQQTALAENRAQRYLAVILDELALMPKGVDLSQASVKGREAGWLQVAAYQSPTMARAAFGRERFDSLVATLKTTVVLNLPDRADAEWAAKRLGDHQGFLTVESGSSSSGPGGGSRSSGWSQSFVTLDNVTPGMIQALPVPTPASPVIEGFMATLPYKPFRFRVHIPELLAALIPEVPPAAPLAPRDPKHFLLGEWQPADYRRLQLAVS